MFRLKEDAERLAAPHPAGDRQSPGAQHPADARRLPGWHRPHKRVSHAYRHAIGPRQRTALASWAAFTATFAVTRAVTYSIKHHVGPLHDVKMGGTHLHHYVWGIGLLSAAGGAAVWGAEPLRDHPAVAAVYGTGLALVVDELALLLELRDVYWEREGRWSIDAAVCLSGLSGSYLAAAEFWQRLSGRRPAGQAGAG